ncbi:MAG TPA: DNA repair protein RecN [Bacteroidia bacterium]|jgi:DNA repair protein RecN (Recombination protein N)|nr:DNA repair protein RecN [Bacteroidia bacterium]
MLHSLHIQNYALIDSIEVAFPDNLAIITGETGAGKSILLGALFLILGQRAETELVNDKSKKCIVEARFTSSNTSVKNFFAQNDLDYDDEILIRREVSPEGKSRAFINDTPVNLSQLKDLTSKLIDIHSQHETLSLNESDFQMSVVDAYASHQKLLDEYRQNYSRYKTACKTLEQMIIQESEAKKEKDYLEFQVNEMEEAKLEMGEDKKIEDELDLLTHAEQIKTVLLSSAETLSMGEDNLLSNLQEVKNKLSAIASYNTSIAELVQRLNSTIIELKDIAGEVEGLEQKIHHDPKKAGSLTERLETIYSLAQKHRVKTVEELIGIQHQISQRLKNISTLEEKIEGLEKEKAKLEETISKQAVKITVGRKKIIPALEKDIQSNLASLGMPSAQFKIEILPTEQFSPSGMDSVRFLFSANKGKELRDVEKVASGGELSRLMLVIKAQIAKLTELPTIIFDEIDTGVSGQVAGKVAELVLRISSSMQVIMITHLPQIASRGNTHFLVYKEENKNNTITSMRQLKPKERVEEIARMISMGQPGSSALKTAAELLQGQ